MKHDDLEGPQNKLRAAFLLGLSISFLAGSRFGGSKGAEDRAQHLDISFTRPGTSEDRQKSSEIDPNRLKSSGLGSRELFLREVPVPFSSFLPIFKSC